MQCREHLIKETCSSSTPRFTLVSEVDLTLHYISQIDVHVDTTSRTQPSANCYLPLQHLVAFHLLVNDIYLLYGQDGQCGKHRKQIAISMFHMDIDSSGETRLYS